MEKQDRKDRFNWDEGDVELYDPQGRRVDPKTLRPIEEHETFIPSREELDEMDDFGQWASWQIAQRDREKKKP